MRRISFKDSQFILKKIHNKVSIGYINGDFIVTKTESIRQLRPDGRISPREYIVSECKNCKDSYRWLVKSFLRVSYRKCKRCNILEDGFTHDQKALIDKRFHWYKADAYLRGFSWDLTKLEFCKIIIKNCAYCGSEPIEKGHNLKSYNKSKPVNKHDSSGCVVKINGIDRIDSTNGYFIENVNPCCTICNIMKMDHDINFFKKHIKKINTYLNL